jgi:hypothetical protein
MMPWKSKLKMNQNFLMHHENEERLLRYDILRQTKLPSGKAVNS